MWVCFWHHFSREKKNHGRFPLSYQQQCLFLLQNWKWLLKYIHSKAAPLFVCTWSPVSLLSHDKKINLLLNWLIDDVNLRGGQITGQTTEWWNRQEKRWKFNAIHRLFSQLFVHFMSTGVSIYSYITQFTR